MNKPSLYCLLSIITFLLSGCSEYHPLLKMRLEIKNPAKAHTFKFYIDPKHRPSYYFSKIHGELDGNAEIRRYEECYYPSCDSLMGVEISERGLSKGRIVVGDSSEYFGGGIIIRYKPKGVTKGRLFIDIRVP